MKIIFAGTPEFAASSLQGLLKNEHENDSLKVVAVYTQPDRPSGRGRKVTISPVKEIAIQYNIPCEQPMNYKSTTSLATLQHYQADAMIVVAYGIILPKSVLDSFPYGCLNVHASLLPRWRGAAPIQRAIEAGDSQTGITIMQMDEGLDTGDMLSRTVVPIAPCDNAGLLHDKLASIGSTLLCETLANLTQFQKKRLTQDDDAATYAQKLSKNEGLIDWSLPAITIVNKVRAFNPWPVAYTTLPKAEPVMNNKSPAHEDNKLRVWACQAINATTSGIHEPGSIYTINNQGIDITTGEGLVRLQEVQLPGGKRLHIDTFTNAHHSWLKKGSCFGH